LLFDDPIKILKLEKLPNLKNIETSKNMESENSKMK